MQRPEHWHKVAARGAGAISSAHHNPSSAITWWSMITVLFSGDQDYLPAIQAFKDSGKHIFLVNFETANKRILPGGSYMLSGLVNKDVSIGQESIIALINEF
jgi:hypothetical protein